MTVPKIKVVGTYSIHQWIDHDLHEPDQTQESAGGGKVSEVPVQAQAIRVKPPAG